jgi:acyl dehydratase
VNEHLYFEDFPVGATREFCRYELTREQIESYAADFDPLLGARRTETGALTASPWQHPALLMRLNYDGWMHEAAARGAPGVDEIRWLRPLTADTLSARYTVRSARVSRSKPHLGLVQFFYELLGGNGEPVFTQLNSVMMALRSPLRQPDAAARTAVRTSDAGTTTDEGAAIALGAADFPADKVIAFARTYDPQPFHVDAVAAQTGPFGALAASGWHTAAGWARAYAAGVVAGTPGLPRPERLLWLKPLLWRRPVFAGNRIAFEFAPGSVEKHTDGDTVMTALGRGRDDGGATIFEFALGMNVSDIRGATAP